MRGIACLCMVMALVAAVPSALASLEPSLSFDRFDQALARGNLDEAEKVLVDLNARHIKDRTRSSQLEKARQIQSLFDEADRQIQSEDFVGLPATWARLNAERNWVRLNWVITWVGPGYPEWLGAELARLQARWTTAREAYVAREKQLFGENLQAKNWSASETAISKLSALLLPVEEMKDQLQKAKAVAAIEASYVAHVQGGDYSEAGKDLARLEAMGSNTETLRSGWRDAYSAACERGVAAALDNRDYGRAEAFAEAFVELGKDPEELRSRVLRRQVQDVSSDFDAALREGRVADAERFLDQLDELKSGTEEKREALRLYRVNDLTARFEAAVASRRFDEAEEMLPGLATLKADTAPLKESLRKARIAAIREGLPALWNSEDYAGIRAKCDLLAGLQDDISREVAQLEAVCGEEGQILLASVMKWTEGVREPDFARAEEAISTFGKRWTALLGRPGTAEADAALATARKKYDLRPRCTEGPLSGGCPEYWLRCRPRTVTDPAEGAQIEGLLVHLVGQAEHVHQSIAGWSTYDLTGNDGDSIKVQLKAGAPTPVRRQQIYLLARVRMTDGGVVLEEFRHVPLSSSGAPLGGEYAEWLRTGQMLNVGDDFLLENLFRKYRLEGDGKALEPLTQLQWVGDTRTRAEEFR